MTTYTLTVEASTNGETLPIAGTYVYDADQNVSVKARSDPGYTILHWLLDGVEVSSANPIYIAMSTNHTIEAVFTNQKRLLVASNNYHCTLTPDRGEHTYTYGSNATVTATPLGAATLLKWRVNNVDAGSANPITVAMTANTTVEAVMSSPRLLDPAYWGGCRWGWFRWGITNTLYEQVVVKMENTQLQPESTEVEL